MRVCKRDSGDSTGIPYFYPISSKSFSLLNNMLGTFLKKWEFDFHDFLFWSIFWTFLSHRMLNYIDNISWNILQKTKNNIFSMRLDCPNSTQHMCLVKNMTLHNNIRHKKCKIFFEKSKIAQLSIELVPFEASHMQLQCYNHSATLWVDWTKIMN